MNIKYFRIIVVGMAILFGVQLTFAEGGGKRNNVLRKTNGSPSYAKFNINKVSTWIKNDGETDYNPQTGNSGLIYPNGAGKTAVFQSGLIWGGYVSGNWRVGGSTYRQGTLAGRILPSGLAEDPNAENVRIFRVRPDYADPNADYSKEMLDEGLTREELLAQYEKDWNEWPASIGAPYDDVDDDGNYNPAVDIPGVPGAHQTIWFVCNDLDPTTAQYIYGALPMGIEMQETIWGYNISGPLENMLFRKFKIINKNTVPFDSMYVAWWSDPDLGDAGDDFVGVDTSLSLGFCYNGNARDNQYGLTPPTVGFDFFQGPIVDGDPTDEAIFDGKKWPGKKNLGMSAFFFFINGDAVYNDPDLGDYTEGALQVRNLFEGKISTTGEKFTDPTTGLNTKFTLSGDPASQTGWVDGILHPPGDRRLGQVAGPFTMAAGDTQEVVLAEIVAGFVPNVDRISSIGFMKFYDRAAQLTYDNFFQVPDAPSAPVVDVAALDEEIIFNWGSDFDAVQKTESHNTQGFKFQGYNVYQLPTPAAALSEAKRLATFDLLDGFAKILGDQFDPIGGVVTKKVLEFGTDSGIQREFSVTLDAFNSSLPLNNGQKYYFAITAYSYNPDPNAVPNVLENTISAITVIPQKPLPGVRYSTNYGNAVENEHAGGGDATVNVTIVDPTAVTGHDYELYLNNQHQYLDVDGEWKNTNYPDSIGKKLAKFLDISGSSVTGAALVSSTVGTIDLIFTLDLVNPGGAWSDGLSLDLPDNLVINSWKHDDANYGNYAGSGQNVNNILGTLDAATNTISWGDSARSGFGALEGTIIFTVNVDPFTLPLTVGFEVYDDGYDGTVVDASGSISITELGYKFRTLKHWNVKDMTTGQDVVEDQLNYGGTNLLTGVKETQAAAPIFDGLRADITGSYSTPLNFLSTDLVTNLGTDLVNSHSASSTTLDISNYTIFSGTISSWAYDNFGVGTQSIDDLQQDYELRFTGVWADSTLGDGRILKHVVSGGQMATVFRGTNAARLGVHPMNPNPGVNEPFLLRIPFEVWNVDDPDNEYQVNLTFRDRLQNGATDDPFYAWNQENRMYALLVNSPYDPNQIIQVDGGADQYNADATWVLVFYATNYVTGEVVSIKYANPLQTGKDSFTWTAPNGPAYNQETAKADVDEVTVFPNPYYGVNPEEINKYQRFVTFSHLPEKATIRIFNLAGQLVRRIDKNSTSQFERWNLVTNDGLPAPSGLFIAHIDMPDLGTTKILKLAVIQEQQVVDRF